MMTVESFILQQKFKQAQPRVTYSYLFFGDVDPSLHSKNKSNYNLYFYINTYFHIY